MQVFILGHSLAMPPAATCLATITVDSNLKSNLLYAIPIMIKTVSFNCKQNSSETCMLLSSPCIELFLDWA